MIAYVRSVYESIVNLMGFSDLAEMERLFPPLKLIDAN